MKINEIVFEPHGNNGNNTLKFITNITDDYIYFSYNRRSFVYINYPNLVLTESVDNAIDGDIDNTRSSNYYITLKPNEFLPYTDIFK